MNSEIKSQIHRMHFVLALLICLGLWQAEFVITAVSANIFLNMTIFGTFAFGVFVAYRNVFNLKNEFIAYNSLREDYEDVVNAEQQEAADPNWRYYRCKEDAIIFVKPQAIEQPFQIISEEIARTNNLNMTIGVMQNLLDSIDARLDERRSLIQYITGILVFLGLIGTFVGLMVTLGSVGEIIGSLDLSGGGGAEAIQGLMDGLKVPLQGMATGFSSSLFGLITSLALGLMSRFSNQASGSLRTSFETWLAGLAKVDADGGTGNGAGLGIQERQLSLIFRAARLSMVSNSRVAATVEQMAKTTDKMIATQLETNSTNTEIASSVHSLAESQTESTKALTHMASLLETREELETLVSDLKQDTVRQAENYSRLTGEMDRLTSQHVDLQEHAAAAAENYVQRDELAWLINETQEHVNEEFTRVHASVENMGKLLSEIDETLDLNAHAMRTSHLELSEKSQEISQELTAAITASREAIRRADEQVERELENAIQDLKDFAKMNSPYFPPAERAGHQQPDNPTPKKRRRFRFFG